MSPLLDVTLKAAQESVVQHDIFTLTSGPHKQAVVNDCSMGGITQPGVSPSILSVCSPVFPYQKPPPTQIGVLGLTFPYNQGESKVQPGFTFMDISDRYVIARGAGGGLALWLRQESI